jgi:Tol biopolymer transport system component
MRLLGVAAALFAAAVAVRAPGAAPPRAAFVAASYGKIVLLSARGDATRTLAPRGDSPAWSRDGRIAFVRDGDIWTVGEDGGHVRRVTDTTAHEESPDWSPDGRLVWSDGHRLLVDGRALTRPPRASQDDRSPQWSPDGRLIAFSSTRPGPSNAGLYLVRPDGSGLRRLTRPTGADGVPGDDAMPAWRPDGSGLVFVSNRDGNWELYSLDLATLSTRRLTRTPVDESLPRLSSDGRYAFVVQVPDGRGRISVANAQLRGRTVRQAGTAVDWRP